MHASNDMFSVMFRVVRVREICCCEFNVANSLLRIHYVCNNFCVHVHRYMRACIHAHISECVSICIYVCWRDAEILFLCELFCMCARITYATINIEANVLTGGQNKERYELVK
jgi:hypothetical protein